MLKAAKMANRAPLQQYRRATADVGGNGSQAPARNSKTASQASHSSAAPSNPGKTMVAAAATCQPHRPTKITMLNQAPTQKLHRPAALHVVSMDAMVDRAEVAKVVQPAAASAIA